MLENCQDIDFHNRSIDLNQDGKLCTPIFSYFKRCKDDIKLENDKVTMKEEHWQKFFGNEPFALTEPIEYFELFNGIFDSKKDIANKVKAYLKQSITEPIDHIFAMKDKNQNNLLHVTGAVFSDNFFPKFT